MPTKIIQIEDIDRDRIILRIEGELLLEDANLLQKIALNLRDKTNKKITLDLSDLDLIDTESAPILKKLQTEHNFDLEGMEFLLQKAINRTENRS